MITFHVSLITEMYKMHIEFRDEIASNFVTFWGDVNMYHNALPVSSTLRSM